MLKNRVGGNVRNELENSTLKDIPEYAALKDKLTCFGKNAAIFGGGTKCNLQGGQKCPAGQKPTGITMRCKRGQWFPHSRTSKYGQNPPICQ